MFSYRAKSLDPCLPKAGASGAGDSWGGQAEEYSAVERALLLRVARCSLEAGVCRGDRPVLDPGYPEKLNELRGCFVTLEKAGELRGCIGHLYPKSPLIAAVQENAQSAALHDPRFSRVVPSELSGLKIEISVLSIPRNIESASPDAFLKTLVPGRDGVVLEFEESRATFLPQVWEKLSEREVFLEQLAVKAGQLPGAWRRPGVKIATYSVQAFRES